MPYPACILCGVTLYEGPISDACPACAPRVHGDAFEQARHTILDGRALGFPWAERDPGPAIAKLRSEVEELSAASTLEARADEIGDALFVLSHLALGCRIDPAEALRAAARKVERRLAYIKGRRALGETDADALWGDAKSIERASVLAGVPATCARCGLSMPRGPVDLCKLCLDPIAGENRERIPGHPAAEACPGDECGVCSQRDCPHGEALHYHHDGCPACAEAEALTPTEPAPPPAVYHPSSVHHDKGHQIVLQPPSVERVGGHALAREGNVLRPVFGAPVDLGGGWKLDRRAGCSAGHGDGAECDLCRGTLESTEVGAARAAAIEALTEAAFIDHARLLRESDSHIANIISDIATDEFQDEILARALEKMKALARLIDGAEIPW